LVDHVPESFLGEAAFQGQTLASLRRVSVMPSALS
jgi:hypothetical protein